MSVVQLLLLHYKANTEAQDNNGNTPLHLACMYGHEDVRRRSLCYVLTFHPPKCSSWFEPTGFVCSSK